MPLVLGVDPSMAHTGLVVLDTDNMRIVYQSAINNAPGSSKDYAVAPYKQIISGIRCLLVEYKIDRVYIEKMFQSVGAAVTEMLFIAAFCARYACDMEGVPFRIIDIMGKPSPHGKEGGWKHFILGDIYTKYVKGFSKIQTRYALEAAFKTKLNNEHTADALGIAVAGWYFDTKIDFRNILNMPIPDGAGRVQEAVNKAKAKEQEKLNALRKREADRAEEALGDE